MSDGIKIGEIKFNGPVALVILAVLIVLKFASIGESTDPSLDDAVRSELLMSIAPRVAEDVKRMYDDGEYEGIVERTRDVDKTRIEIHSIRVSVPLSDLIAIHQDAVVRVEFTLPRESRRVEYHRFSSNLIGGWRHRYETTVVSYYLNFL